MNRIMWLFLSVLVLAVCQSMGIPPPDGGAGDERIRRSSFIFQGTVGAILERNALEARVDRILKGRETIGDFTGQSVTVALAEPAKLQPGAAAVFYTNVREYGERLTLEAVGYTAGPGNEQKLDDEIAAEDRKAADEAVRKRLARAELVVLGVVVEAPEQDPELRSPPPSEHWPNWRWILVRVEETLKGESGAIAGLFYAASDDIHWFRSPKPKLEERAIFLLQRFEEQTATMPQAPEPGPVYALVDPLDLQPADELERVKQLLASAG